MHTSLKESAVAFLQFRFEGERIVELWDGQPVPEESVNQNGMF
jgi:hypothetical protein